MTDICCNWQHILFYYIAVRSKKKDVEYNLILKGILGKFSFLAK